MAIRKASLLHLHRPFNRPPRLGSGESSLASQWRPAVSLFRSGAWLLRALLAAAWLFCALSAHAQTGSGAWSEVEVISDPDTASHSPAIVADRYGQVHVFWSSATSKETFGVDEMIAYTRWNGEDWLKPIEILASPGGGPALSPAAAADPQGKLHVVWIGQLGALYYSRASTSAAGSAHSWTTPKLLAEAVRQENLAMDARGTLHLVYASFPPADIYYMKSVDGGVTWSQQGNVSSMGYTLPQEYVDFAQLALDSQDRIHVVWVELSSRPETAYGTEAVWYARSVDGGQTWSRLRVDSLQSGAYLGSDSPHWITVGIDGQDNVHLVWNGPNGYRVHQWSSDGGETWTQPSAFLSITGIAGWHAMAMDGSGTLNLVTCTIKGMYYARWDGEQWADLAPVPGMDGERAAAVASEGNSFHAVITTNPLGGNILHISRLLSAPHVAPEPLPTPSPVATQPPASSPTATPPPEPTAESSGNSLRQPLPAPVITATSPGVAVGALAALLIVVIATLVYLARLRRR
jgi:hypothetical protein